VRFDGSIHIADNDVAFQSADLIQPHLARHAEAIIHVDRRVKAGGVKGVERHPVAARFHRDAHIVKLIGGSLTAHGDRGFHLGTVPAFHQHATLHVHYRDVAAGGKLKTLLPDALRPEREVLRAP
jgi:hypothetical protein